MSDYRGPRGRAGLPKTTGQQEGLRGIGRGSNGGNRRDLVESQFLEDKSEKNAQNHATTASKTDEKERLGWAPGVGRGRGISKQENIRKVKVPSECAGLVIGKAGAKIRELKETSGANVNVPSRENRGEEVEVELSGTEEQINKAQDLIEKLTLTGKHKIVDVKDESTATSGGGGATFWGSANYGAPAEDKFEDAEVEEELIDWGAALRECNEAQKLKWSKLPALIKDFYKEHPDVASMSDEEVQDFRKQNNNIEVKNFKEDDDTPLLKPVTKFHHAFRNYPDIMATINKQGFANPSPIQCQAWPYLLAGKDCIGIAQTGTGKTLAFLMPAFIHIDGQPTPRGRRGGPNVLVLSPTRELALQIAQEVKKYEYHGIKSVCIYGGGSRKDQCKVVTDGVEIIIATPGRLNDLVESGFIAVESITYLVLDEADRMLDMGFEPQIRKVLLDIRPDRQTIMTSATWPENVRRMARSYMNNPVTVFIGSLDLAAVHSVTQRIEKVEEENKFAYLLDFIRSMDPDDKIIVFVMRKSRCDEIASELAMKYISCQAIHGDREQSDREQALQDLRTGDVKILIATDVASRGIDIEDVTHVLNYDFPRDIEDYVHRVGRTGRAGKTGQSLSLWTKQDWKHAPELVPIMEEAGQEIPEWLARDAVRYPAWKKEKDDKKKADGGGRGGGDGCFRCGESGHFSRECPKGVGGRVGGRGGGGGRGMGSRKW